MACRPRPAAFLALMLLCAAPTLRADPDLPALFRIGQDSKVGFISRDGAVVVPPVFDGCARDWSEGFLWVLSSRHKYYSGHFLRPDGSLLMPEPAGRYGDDILRIPPQFIKGRAIVETAPGEFRVVTRDGIVLGGRETRDADWVPFERDGHFGFRDETGRETLPPRHDAAKPFLGETAAIARDGRWGLIDRAGRWRLAPDFDAIYAAEEPFWIASQTGKLGLLRPDGSWVHEPAFDEFHRWGPDVVSVRRDDDWGLLDTREGRLLIPVRYEAIDLPGPRAVWARRDGRWGLLRHDNQLLQPFEFASVRWLSPEAGLWLAVRDGRQGLIDADGELLQPCACVSITRTTDPYVAVRTDSGTGLYDTESRQWVISPRHEQVACWPGMAGISAAVRSDGRWGLLRLNDEKPLLAMEHDSLCPWNRLILARQGRKLALFDSAGKPVLPWDAEISALPDPGTGMTNGCGKVVCRGKAGIIDAAGSLCVPCRFEDVGLFSEGAAPARQDGQWGFVRPGGDWLIPPRFDQARAFCGGFATVFLDGRAGVIDRQGELRIPCDYADAGYVFQGLLPVAIESDRHLCWGLLHPDGTPALPFDYEAIEWVDFPPAHTRIHGRSGWDEL